VRKRHRYGNLQRSETGAVAHQSASSAEPDGHAGEEYQVVSLPSKQLVLSLGWAAAVLLVTLIEQGLNVLNPLLWLSIPGIGIIALAGLPAVVAMLFAEVVNQLRELSHQKDRQPAVELVDVSSDAAMSGKIVSIRHAVHKELAALNDHLERSLNKTSEIETAVKREVAALERSFGDNERRLLALVQELARQRESVVTTTEKVTGAVKATRESLNDELGQLATQVMEAGNYARGVARDVAAELRADLEAQSAGVAESLRQSLETEIAPLSLALGEQVQSIQSLLSTGGDGLVSTIEHHGSQLSANINAAWDRISRDLESQSVSADEMATRLQTIVGQSLESNVNQLESRIRSASIEIRDEMDKSAEQITRKILDLAVSNSAALDTRIDTFQSDIDTQLSNFSQLMNKASDGILPSIQRHNDKLERVIELEAAFERSTERLGSVLTDQAAAFVDVLSQNVTTFQERFDDQAKTISEGLLGKLDWAVSTLEDGSRRFTTTLIDVQDTISLASDKLTISVAEHQSQFAQRVNQMEALVFDGAERIDENLAKGVAGLSAALEDGTRQIEVAFAQRNDGITSALSTGLGSADLLFQERILELEGLNDVHQAKLRSVLGAAVDSLDAAVTSSSHMLMSASDSIQKNLTAGTARFSDGIAELKSNLNIDLESFASVMRESLTQVGVDEASVMKERILEMVEAVQARVSAVYSGLDSRSREFEANIAQFGANIDTQTSRLQRVISQKSESIEQSIELGIERLGEALQMYLERTEETVSQFAAQDTELFQRQLSRLKDVLSDQTMSIDERVNAVYVALDGRSKQFEGRLAEFGAALEKQASTLQAAVVERTQRLETSLDVSTGKIGELLTTKLGQTQKLVDDFVDSETEKFDHQIEVLSRTLDGRSQILDSIMRTRGADFTDQLYASSRHLEEELTSTSRALEAAIRTGSGEMQATLSAQVSDLQQALALALQQSKAEAVAQIAAAGTVLSEGADRLKETLQTNLATVADSLESGRMSLGALLEGENDAISGMLAEQGKVISESLAKHASDLDADLGKRIADLELQLLTRGTAIAAVLDARSSTLQDLLQGGADSIARVLGQHGKQLADVIGDGAGTLAGDLGRRVVELETRLLSQTNAMVAALDSSSVALEQLLDGGSSKLARTLAQYGKRIGEVLSDGAGAIDSDFAHRLSKMEAELDTQTNTLVAALDRSSDKVVAAVDQATQELEKTTREKIADAKAALESAVDATSRNIVASVDSTQQKITSSVDGLISKLATHEKAATGRMENAAASVGESTRKAAEQTAERLVTVNGALAQVLSSLGTQRPSTRKGKVEALPNAAE